MRWRNLRQRDTFVVWRTNVAVQASRQEVLLKLIISRIQSSMVRAGGCTHHGQVAGSAAYGGLGHPRVSPVCHRTTPQTAHDLMALM